MHRNRPYKSRALIRLFFFQKEPFNAASLNPLNLRTTVQGIRPRGFPERLPRAAIASIPAGGYRLL